MYNIRIKQLPKNGDQRNYSLVDRNDLYIKVNPINQDSNVKNTISAVPREEANIEAEGGETVIGDINNDGFLEHNKIVGKRHSEGGVPLNVAPGSFIFSDTKKLKIKDPEVLSIFGITNIPKGGITPAKIANKYPMNNYMNIMKDDSNDPISKRTASKMLENSLEKLGMLALIQEAMKGFPDGIPAIAESVMAGMQGPEMQGAPQEMMEGQEASEEGQMRYGGSAYYQTGGNQTYPAVSLQNNPSADLSKTFYKDVTKPGGTHFDKNLNREVPNLQTPAEYRYSIENNNWRGDGDGTGQTTLMSKNDYDALTEINDDNYDSVTSNKTKNTADERLAIAMKYYNQNNNKGFEVPGVYSASDVDRKGTKDAQGNYINLPASKDMQTQYDNTLTRRYGGIAKYQAGSTTKEPQRNKITQSGNPVPGFKFYSGITPVTVTKLNNEFGVDNPNSAYIELSNGQRITKKQFEQLNSRGYYKDIQGGVGDIYTINQNVQKRTIKDSDGNPIPGFDLYSGDKINYKNKDYTVVNPNADNSRGYYSTWKPLRDTFDNTQGIVQVRNNKTGQYEYIEVEDLGDAYKFDKTQVPMYPNQNSRSAYLKSVNDMMKYGQIKLTNPGYDIVEPSYVNQKSQGTTYVPPGQNATQETSNPAMTGAQPLDTTLVEQDRTQRVVIKEDNAGAAPKRTQKAPVNVAPKNANKTPATSSGIPVEYTNDFEYGGSLPEHQGTNQGVPSTVQPPKEKTIVKWQVSNTTGKKRPVYSDGTIGEPIEYNVADEDLRTQVGAKGYDFFDLPEDLRYKKKTVGPQTSQTGFILDPESGFLYHPDPNVGAPKPGKRGLEEYMKIHADAINAYPGGAEKWKQDQIAAKGKANPAMKHLLEYQNAAIGQLSGNKPYINMNIEGALVPGVENYNLPGIRKKAPVGTPEVKQTVAEKKDIVIPQIQNQVVGKRRRPWWLQDQVNFAGAMTDMIDKYGPAMAQFDLETPGYALEDPARQIAAIQENSAANREALMNTTAGNVAGASMASQSPTDLANVANVIGNVQNRNVGTYNQVSNIGAQINNQEQSLNQNAKQKYIADSATANQQYANALRDLKWNRIKAFNQGTSNFQRTNQLESMFPQYGFDRMTGDIAFAGGREAYDAQGNPLYDTYVNPFGSTDKSSGSGYLSGTELATLKKQYIDAGFSEQQAIDLIKEQTGRASSSSRTRQNSVANAVVSGQTLPQQAARYGGYMKQYGGTVFDFGALPMYFFED